MRNLIKLTKLKSQTVDDEINLEKSKTRKSYYRAKPQINHQQNQTQIEKVLMMNIHILKKDLVENYQRVIRKNLKKKE